MLTCVQIVGHGANPGLVSHLVKAALQNLSLDLTGQRASPTCTKEWAELARSLGIKGIHIAGMLSHWASAGHG